MYIVRIIWNTQIQRVWRKNRVLKLVLKVAVYVLSTRHLRTSNLQKKHTLLLVFDSAS